MSPFARATMHMGVLVLPGLFLTGAAFAEEAGTTLAVPPHPIAVEHLPIFITAPGQTDILFNVVAIFLLAFVLIIGNLYFQLHAVPERMAHRASQVQMEIVAVLALISLFTHNHLYWIAGLLLAFIQFPDFSTPMESIARSLEKLSRRDEGRGDALAIASDPGAEGAVARPPSRLDSGTSPGHAASAVTARKEPSHV
jgi:hypothetical protein